MGSWAIEFNIPHSAINSLLNALNIYQLIVEFFYVLQNKILRKLDVFNRVLIITLDWRITNIKKQRWSISANFGLHDSPSIFDKVFPVGLYYGHAKPNDSNECHLDFVNEARALFINGIYVNESALNVFCSDAPAKTFILKTKGHSGFSLCTKCHVEGEYHRNRVCFPYFSVMSAEITHEEYVGILDEDHHVSTQSILAELPNINVVKLFSLDYMHLVCLGVIKKL